MKNSAVSVGLVGAGYWGPNLLRNFAETPGCQVTRVCDSRPEALGRVGKRFPQVHMTTRFEDLLEDQSLDAIIIATPAATHAAIATLALTAGKHVLVEKPLCADVKAGEALVDLAGAQGRVLMVGHTFEYNVAVRKLKEIISNEAFGDVVYAYSRRVNLGILREDVNALWNLAPHDVSILLYLFDEFPSFLSAQGHAHIRQGVEDVSFVHLEFPSGRTAHIHVSWLDPSKARSLTVIGAKQMAVYDDLDPEARLKIYDCGFQREQVNTGVDHSNPVSYTFRAHTGDIVCPYVEWKEPLALECRHFIQTIVGDGVPLTDGINGLRVVQVLESANLSMRQQGQRVEVPCPQRLRS